MICRYFMKASGCRRGTKCPYLHDVSSCRRMLDRKSATFAEVNHTDKESAPPQREQRELESVMKGQQDAVAE